MRGGKRANSGTKKGSKHKKTIEQEEARKILRDLVFAELRPIVMAQIDAAKGLYVEEIDKFGKVRRYQKEPDKQAAQLLIEHAMGRPPNSLQLPPGNGELIVRWQT